MLREGRDLIGLILTCDQDDNTVSGCRENLVLSIPGRLAFAIYRASDWGLLSVLMISSAIIQVRKTFYPIRRWARQCWAVYPGNSGDMARFVLFHKSNRQEPESFNGFSDCFGEKIMSSGIQKPLVRYNDHEIGFFRRVTKMNATEHQR
jgi:hypothetical protein